MKKKSSCSNPMGTNISNAVELDFPCGRYRHRRCWARDIVPVAAAVMLVVSDFPPSARAEDRQAFEMTYMTPAYKEAAVRMLIEEANDIAKALHLPEQLPITRDDLVEVYVDPLIEHTLSFGNITTRRYMYTAAIGAKMSGVERTFGESSDARIAYSEALKRKYRAPLAQLNTNAAYTLATNWLAAASFDVPAIERAARPQVYAWLDGDYFVPLYIVLFPGIAEIHLVEPEKVLLSLSVNKPQYIKRKKLSVPNRDWVLQQTNDPTMRKRWLITDAYKASALTLMMAEATAACRALKLQQPLPLSNSRLTEYTVEPPYFSDKLGMFGTIATDEYIFTFRPENKLGFVSKNFRLRDD